MTMSQTMSHMPPLISVAVIIPTLGRDKCVRDVLRDLDAQDYAAMEVWLVDQNSKSLEGLDRVLKSKKLFHEKTKPLGSHGGRNHAIFKTKAGLCVFVDDDVRLEPDFISKHVKCMAAAPDEVGSVAGKVIQPKDGLSDEVMKKLGSLARYNVFTGRVTGNFIGSVGGEVDHIHECNFSARTGVLKAAGGFNEAFDGNAFFEGVDLGMRIKKAGFKMIYEPSVSLVHLQEGVGGNRVGRKSEHIYWMMRNQALLNSLHMKQTGVPVFFGRSVGYVLAKAVKNLDITIAAEGLKGLLYGAKYFF